MQCLHLSRACLFPVKAVGRLPSRLHRPHLPHRLCGAATTQGQTTTVDASLLNPTAPAILNAEDILDILPHRYPLLLVDRVTQLEEEKMIVGLKNVTMNDNFFTGHFPDRPIMPGVLQVEAMAQLAGILILKNLEDSARGQFFFGGIENCRFRKPVIPGDTLMMKIDVKSMKLRRSVGVVKVHGVASVAGDTVCDADLTLVLAKPNGSE